MPMRLLYFVPKADNTDKSPLLFAWRPQGNYLAFTNSSSSIKITDHYGELFDEFIARGKDKFLEWHKEGDFLATVGTTPPHVTLYTMSTKEAIEIELGLATKESPTFCIWSDISPVLVVCTNRGNVFFLNVLTSRKTPVLGKHQRPITTGAFNNEGLLALGSEDATITISNAQGDSVSSFGCNAEPETLYYIPIYDQYDKECKEYFIAAVLNKKTLMVSNALGTEAPVNLQFQEKYGNIRKCCWFEKAHVLIAFETGNVVCLSVHRQAEQSQELFSIKDYEHYLSDLALCQGARMAITLGDNCIKVRHLDRLSELMSLVTVDEDSMGLEKVKPNNNGTLLAISGKSGTMMIFLTKIPTIGAAYRDRIVWLSSINEVTVTFDGDIPPIGIEVRVEPSQLAVCENYVAVVTNNRAWFYEINGKHVAVVNDYEYLSTVNKIKMNSEYVMALLDGRAQLHKILTRDTEDAVGESTTFPIQTGTMEYSSIVDADITEKFFIYCTESNHICFFSMTDWAPILDFKHTCGIQKIVAEFTGIRVCFFDDRYGTFIFCPSSYEAVKIPDEGSNYSDCLWENFTIDKDTFVLINGQELTVFIASKLNDGICIQKIGNTPIPYGHVPMMMSKGIIFSMTQSGRINTFILDSQRTETNLDGKNAAQLQELLKQQLVLKRWRNAWKICEQSNDEALWVALAEEALKNYMFQLAAKVYKHINNVAMAWTVEELMDKEDQQLVKGTIAMLMGKYDDAQTAFLESGHGELALDMRRDILHWDKAVELAKKVKPSELPVISKEYANQLEFLGKYDEALKHYEDAIMRTDGNTGEADVIIEHNEYCQGGIARMAIRVGDINRGVNLAKDLPNRSIKRDCGLLLEQIKQFNEAGKLYELGIFYDRAAAAYIRAKNWAKIKELGDKVRSPKILAQYGKVLEAEKKYAEALKAYMNASNYEGAVRMMVDHLNMVEDAVKIVRESKSNEGAKTVAKHFNKMGESAIAIEFLVISKCYQEAFQLAEAENLMEVFADTVEAEKAVQQYEALSKYYSSKHRDPIMAGKFYLLNGEYKIAMDSLLGSRDDDKAMPLAIQCAVESKDLDLIKQLTGHLLGDKDGVPKDPNFIFRLYVEMHMYSEAAKTAIILSEEEQKRGNYKIARDLLFQMQRQLILNNLHVPAIMVDSLTLLHSYLIVKPLIKRNDQKTAARMLIRVADNISSFSAHMVDILTSTVIICTKAGLNASAFKYAVQLLRPELRKNISEKYRKKIESIVRKAKDAKDEEESKSPCPFCNEHIPETALTCQFCKNKLPACIITGKHVVVDDFALCSNCEFPGSFSAFKKLAAKNEKCPMCGASVNDVTPTNANVYIQLKYGSQQ